MATVEENLKLIKNAVYGKDVRNAIHDSIKQCYEEGRAGSADLEARDAIEELRGQIAGITSLPEGSTTGDAELADIRVMESGEIATSAGEAVRTQIRRLTNKFNDLDDAIGIIGVRLDAINGEEV